MKKLSKKTVIRILLFFSISFITSFIFRYWILINYKNISIFQSLLYGILSASGPFLAGLILMKKSNSEMSLWGNFNSRIILTLFIPSIIFGFFGSKVILINQNISGIIIGLYISIYSLLEEYGWRGYLQSELRDIKPILIYFIVSFFWYLWHLTFLGQTSFINEIITFLILFASSIGIGVMADRSKSILYASYFHILGNICFLSSLLIENIDVKYRYLTVILIIIINIIEFKRLKNKLKSEEKNN